MNEDSGEISQAQIKALADAEKQQAAPAVQDAGDGSISHEQARVLPETYDQSKTIDSRARIANRAATLGQPPTDESGRMLGNSADMNMKPTQERKYVIAVKEPIKCKIGLSWHLFVPEREYTVRETVKNILKRRGVLEVV